MTFISDDWVGCVAASCSGTTNVLRSLQCMAPGSEFYVHRVNFEIDFNTLPVNEEFCYYSADC